MTKRSPSAPPTEYCPKKLAQRFGPYWPTNQARRLRNLPKAEAAVLYFLCAHADKNGAGFVKATTIAAESGYERNAINRAYKKLCRRGYVRRIQLKAFSGQHCVYGYAVVMPLRLCEIGVRHLDVDPCDALQQLNSPVQQYNKNADELFAFEAALMDLMWRYIDFDTTPKLISVMPISKEVFSKDPSLWPSLKAFVLQTAEEEAVRLDSWGKTLKNWAVVARAIKIHAEELTRPLTDRCELNATKAEYIDQVAEFLTHHLRPGQRLDQSLKAALKDICSIVTEEEILIKSVSLRTLDIIECECARSLTKLARSRDKRVVLVWGDIRRLVFQL